MPRIHHCYLEIDSVNITDMKASKFGNFHLPTAICF